jgi:hypothetical protein
MANNTATQPGVLPLVTPLTWRKLTPLHKKLGARAMRFMYNAGASPLLANMGGIEFRYDAVSAIDRVIGFCLSIGPPSGASAASTFTISDANTGWNFNVLWSGAAPLYVMGNAETYADMANLSWNFDVQVQAPVYLSLFNVEVVPCAIGL